MFALSPTDLRFPPVDFASPEGLLAMGGDLRAERLLGAYRHGIFPWYNEGQPILWWSPDPRAVLFPAQIKVSRSLRKAIRNGGFDVRLDTRFHDVMQACAQPRVQHPRGGTWITSQMLEAYTHLHELGYAHCVETWHDGELVGGLYGVALGGMFFGESMFSRRTDASKVALVWLARQLQRWEFRLIDCQLPSPHLVSLGAEEIRRSDFLDHLGVALRQTQRQSPWQFDETLAVP
jgi:leucyl/phenylalanyl-tRNA---protein transferase